jgi:hypothetical protein
MPPRIAGHIQVHAANFSTEQAAFLGVVQYKFD